MDKNRLLRSLPKVDEVLRQPAVAALELPQSVITDLVRESIDGLRREILSGDQCHRHHFAYQSGSCLPV